MLRLADMSRLRMCAWQRVCECCGLDAGLTSCHDATKQETSWRSYWFSLLSRCWKSALLQINVQQTQDLLVELHLNEICYLLATVCWIVISLAEGWTLLHIKHIIFSVWGSVRVTAIWDYCWYRLKCSILPIQNLSFRTNKKFNVDFMQTINSWYKST